LTDREVWRWLRGQVRPCEWLPRICRLFQCHQARLGWPAQGNELAIDFSPSNAPPGAALPAAATPQPAAVAVPSAISPFERTAGTNPTRDWAAWFSMRLAQLLALVDQWSVDADSCIPLQLLLHQEVLMFDAVGPSGQDQHYDCRGANSSSPWSPCRSRLPPDTSRARPRSPPPRAFCLIVPPASPLRGTSSSRGI
jgi:hypothetical protein